MQRILIIIGICLIFFSCRRQETVEESTENSHVVVTNEVDHNEIYKRGSNLISPHMNLLGRDPKLTEKVKEQVSRGIADLDAVTAYNPDNWAAFWIKGKGYQVLGNSAAAKVEFKMSFGIQKKNPDVAREYASTCLDLGLADEAIRATEHAIKLMPNDAGLHANLALAYLIAGNNAEAEKAINHSIKMSPDDQISQAVFRIVDEVISGKRPQPKNMEDLYKGIRLVRTLRVPHPNR